MALPYVKKKIEIHSSAHLSLNVKFFVLVYNPELKRKTMISPKLNRLREHLDDMVVFKLGGALVVVKLGGKCYSLVNECWNMILCKMKKNRKRKGEQIEMK